MLLLSTSSLQWYWIHRIFDFVKKSWYDGIDLSLNKQNFDLWDGDYIKSLSNSFWVPVLSITAPLKWMNEKNVNQIVKLWSKLNSQIINFFPPHFSDKNINWFTKYLIKVKRDSHMSICISNVEPKFIFFIIPEYKNSSLYEIKKITGDSVLDLASIDSSSWMDILKAQKILWSSLKNIFLSDKQWAKSWLLPGLAWWGISYLPLESFFMKLKTTGYNWFVTLKVNKLALWIWNEEIVIQNLDFVKKYYEKHFLKFK